MSNYFKNSHLVKSNHQYEIYSFLPDDDLYKLISNTVSQIEFDFGHNILRIPNDKDSVFSLSIEKLNIDQELINVDRNKDLLNNLGKFKDRIIVKENYQLKNSSDSQKKRKFETDNFSDKHSPAKKSLIESSNNFDSEDDLGSRLSTRPKVTRSFPMKTKINILDELKSGKKTIKQISNSFNISENKITEFQMRESDIRRQFKESQLEQIPSQQQIPQKTDAIIKPPMNNNNNNKLNKSQIINTSSKINEKSPIESSKCVLNLDFEVKNENGKLIFGEPQKKISVNFPAFTLQLPKNHPDIPKSDVPTVPLVTAPAANAGGGPAKKVVAKNSMKKILSTENRNPTSIPPRSIPADKIMSKEEPLPFRSINNSNNSEPRKPLQNSMKLKQENQISNKLESYQTAGSATTVINNSNNREMKLGNKPHNHHHHQLKHYPTDPIVKNEPKSSLSVKPKALIKSSTNQYEPPKSYSSPFRYLVIDPDAIEFAPSEIVDSEIRSTNFDGEEFIDEVQKSYDRFTECANLYDKYRLKRVELKNKVNEIKTDKEITELYKEFYRLADEEKLPFFVNLEKEVIALQNKLTKAADILGIKLNQ